MKNKLYELQFGDKIIQCVLSTDNDQIYKLDFRFPPGMLREENLTDDEIHEMLQSFAENIYAGTYRRFGSVMNVLYPAAMEKISMNIPTSMKAWAQSVFNIDKEEAELYIALPARDVPLLDQEAVVNAAGEFMEAMGYELEMKEEPIHGSFFQRLLFWRNIKLRAEANDIAEKGKLALEAQFLNLPTAEATAKMTEAAAKMLDSLKDYPVAFVRVGSLMVLKVITNGMPKVYVESISPKLASTLNDFPALKDDPNAIYTLLVAEKKSQNVIEGTGTDVTV